jgi:hypothetical protein
MSSSKDITPPGQPDDGIDPETWAAFIKSLASGMTVLEAQKLHGLLSHEITVTVLNSQIAGKNYHEALLRGRANRWTAHERQEVFSRLGRGFDPERAIAEVRGSDDVERDEAEFFELVSELPDWGRLYEGAMRARDLREERETLRIADDCSRDTLPGPKGSLIPNMSAVQRDRLRIDVRKDRRKAWNPERFAEHRQVQMNVSMPNYAEILEAARNRVVQARRRFSAEEKAQAADAEFTPVRGALTSDAGAAPKRKPMSSPVSEQAADALRERVARAAEAEAPPDPDTLRERAVAETPEKDE